MMIDRVRTDKFYLVKNGQMLDYFPCLELMETWLKVKIRDKDPILEVVELENGSYDTFLGKLNPMPTKMEVYLREWCRLYSYEGKVEIVKTESVTVCEFNTIPSFVIQFPHSSFLASMSLGPEGKAIFLTTLDQDLAAVFSDKEEALSWLQLLPGNDNIKIVRI